MARTHPALILKPKGRTCVCNTIANIKQIIKTELIGQFLVNYACYRAIAPQNLLSEALKEQE